MNFRSVYIVLALLLFFQNVNAGGYYCRGRRGRRLVIINPPTLLDPTPFGYSQILVDTKNAVAHVAGQNAVTRNGSIIGDTLEEQLQQTFINIGLALEAVEADQGDILKAIVVFAGVDATAAVELLEVGVMGGPPAAPSVVFNAESLEKGLLVEIQVDVAVSESFVRRLICH